MIISRSAFSGCTSLERVDISNDVVAVESFAFEDCIALRGIVIPRSVSAIEVQAFKRCANLTIYTKYPTAPSGWAYRWNDVSQVVWDAIGTIEESNALLKEILTKLAAARIYLSKEDAARKYIPANVADARYISKSYAKDSYLTVGSAEANYAKKTDITAIYRYCGSVQNLDAVPEDPEVGDVYNVIDAYTDAAGTTYAAGTNFAWTGSEWDPLGGSGGSGGSGDSSAAGAKLYRHDLHFTSNYGTLCEIYVTLYNTDATNYSSEGYFDEDAGEFDERPDTEAIVKYIGNGSVVASGSYDYFETGDGFPVVCLVVRNGALWCGCFEDAGNCIVEFWPLDVSDIADTVTEIM